ncbi:MAG TPA: S-layer homology domain-containing protein [Acidimicrobiia bacterium]|nr:S-layer homology domain-containing protein [Acidimicrobiia bacterium]
MRADAKAAGFPTEWLWSVDPKDWQKPGVDKILAALKGMRDGDVIVLHDSVGKTQTFEAVRLFLAQHHNDYIFRTLPDCGLGKPPIPGPYDDVFGDHRFANDIEWLRDTGLTRGCNPDGTRFCPEDYVTRGEMAAFVTRALKLPASSKDWFRDVNGSIFESAINAIADAGITRGCNPPANDRFCPNDFVTRGQMAALLVRALGYTDNGGGDLFVDDNGNTFEIDIDKLGTAGVTRGCNPPVNDRFCPNEFVTRGQMAAILHRALGG